MGKRAITLLVDYGVNSSPVVAGDRIIAMTFIEVFCLAADRDEVLQCDPKMDGIHGPPAVGDNVAIVSGDGFDGIPTQLRAFDLTDGSECQHHGPESNAKGAPVVAGGAMSIVTSDVVHVVDLAIGERRLHVEVRTGEWTTPVATPEAAYLSTRDGELLSLAPSDGIERWWSPGNGASVATDDVLHVAADGETATLSRDDEKEAVTRFVDAPYTHAREVVLAFDEQEWLAAYNTDEECQLWIHQAPEVQVSNVVSQGVAITAPVDGAAYVVVADGFHGLGAAQD